MTQLDSNQYLRLTFGTTYGQSDGLYYDKTNSTLVLVINDNIIFAVDTNGAIVAGALEAPDLSISGQSQGDLLRYSGSAWERLAAGTSGQILVGDGSDVISVAASGDVTSISAAGAFVVNDVTVGSDAQGDILYKNSTPTAARLAIGTAGQVLRVNSGATAPEWVNLTQSWAFSVGGANGEDTDGAGTNGGGILGGGAVDVTTHDYNNAGGGNADVHVKVYDAGDDLWDDLSTSSSLTGWTANYQLLPDAASEAVGDAFAVGFANQFCEFGFNDMSTGGGALATWSGAGGKYQYSTGAGTWSDLTVHDNTDTVDQTGGQTLARVGAISFAPPADWVVATYDGVEAYWVQYVLTGTTLTQTPIIDSTNKDEPFVVVPTANTFIAPRAGSITAVRVTDLGATVHDQAIKFVLAAFTETKPATGFSISAEQTWDASVRCERFDLSGRPVVVAAGDRIGICVTDDGGSTNNPVWAVDMAVNIS